MWKSAVLLLGLLAMLGSGVFFPALAQAPQDQAVPLTGDISLQKTSMLQALDASPLGERIPLILVHGINPNPDKDFGWSEYLDYTEELTDYQRRYKTYMFVFDPARPVAENSEALRLALRSLIDALPDHRPIRISALSLGGLLVKMAFDDERIRNRTDRFIGIGVPFHGTPLANPAWIRARLKENSPFSILRMSNRVAYRLTRNRFPNFMPDFCWDNFDGLIPPRVQQKSPCQGTDYGADRAEVPTILYAAFFGTDDAHDAWLRGFLDVPETHGQSHRLPQPFSRHLLFNIVQPAIADLPLAEPAPLTETPEDMPPVMVFNDGISPISSQLWLGRFVQAADGHPIPRAVMWETIGSLKNTREARLFEGLDHRDWLEGRTRHKRDARVSDLLHPAEPPRTVFEWLVRDLMTDSPVIVRQGEESQQEPIR